MSREGVVGLRRRREYERLCMKMMDRQVRFQGRNERVPVDDGFLEENATTFRTVLFLDNSMKSIPL